MRKLILLILLFAVPVCLGVLSETELSSYQLMRTVTSEDANLVTYHFADANRTANSVDLHIGHGGATRANNLQLIVGGEGDADEECNIKLWMYANQNGPAQLVADVNCVLGTANVTTWPDGTSADSEDFWADTITINSEPWLTDVKVSDSGNNRISSVAWDGLGHRYLLAEVSDVNVSSDPNFVKIYYRWF